MQHREDLVEMALRERAWRLQRVGVDTEGDLNRDIDGEAHQVAAQVHLLPPDRRLLPTPLKSPDRDLELGE